MSRKKTIIDILIITVAFLLFIVWYNSTHISKHRSLPASSISHYRVYLITIDKEDEFWHYINQGAAEMANMLGVTYIWDAPQEKDTRQQINVLNNAVENRADAIMIAVNDPVQLSGAIEDAKARGIRIVYVDTPANEEAEVTLATNNYEAGITAGETMLEELSELGIETGSVGIIGVNTATISTMDRERGFREVIDRDGRFTVLQTAYRNGDPIDSEASALEFINQNIDLVGLFGTNEGSTIGVGNAIRSSQNDRIVGVGFDRSETILELLNEGSLDVILVQNPFTMGYLGMAEAIAALQGFETGPPFLDTGVSVIRRR